MAGDHRAKAVADKMQGAGRNLGQQRRNVTGEGCRRAVAHAFVRASVAGQVDGDDAGHGADDRQVEHPVVEIAAKAVQENNCRRAGAKVEVAQAARLASDADLADDGFWRGWTSLGIALRALRVLGQQGVDLRLVGARLAQNRYGLAAGHHGPRFRQNAQQHARAGAFQHIGDLRGFDIDQFVARTHRIARGAVPDAYLALFHRQAPFGHGDQLEAAHGRMSLAAAMMRAADGM